MILTCAEMKALEERALADGIEAEQLMEEAGAQIAAAVAQFFPQPGKCAVYFGKGHNGGDALVAARHLAARGWEVKLQPAFPASAWSPLTAQKGRELKLPRSKKSAAAGPRESGPLILLDGLLGIGAGGALREPIRAAAREINRRRVEENAHVFAIDLPTGLDGDSGAADANCVVADFTLSIGFAKRGLLADGATRCVGRMAVLPLAELSARAEQTGIHPTVATAHSLAPLLPRRPFELHKGQCGRVGIVAGSAGLTGAAVLCAEACVRAGAGLVTLYVTPDIYPLVATRIAPEVMVKATASCLEVLDERQDVLALGPGLGTHRAEVLKLLQRARQPTVIDADALTMLAPRLDLLGRCAGPRLLTPHAGEMRRLDEGSAKRPRSETVERFTALHPSTLLLKGARTLVGEHGRAPSFNTTGSPGMATGGMGDVLTGVCAAFAGQGLELYDAARLGAWLCGRAAELAVFGGGESEESLVATHVIGRLGEACKNLRAGCW